MSQLPKHPVTVKRIQHDIAVTIETRIEAEQSKVFIEPNAFQVEMLKPDLALALTWWSVTFPNSKQKVVGNTTMNLQKFDDGWK